MKIAKTIGFPVVAKVVSAEILHKSDVGGVVLNLNSAAEVRKAFDQISARVKKLKNKPKIDGILIAQQVKADLELVVGTALDAEMGPVVLVRHRRRRDRTDERRRAGRRAARCD